MDDYALDCQYPFDIILQKKEKPGLYPVFSYVFSDFIRVKR